MPLDLGSFLSGAALDPCPRGPQAEAANEGADSAGGEARGLAAVRPPLSTECRQNYLPVLDLGRRLAAVLALQAGLAERLPSYIWREQPDPLPACRELDDLIAALERIEAAASEARTTCLFLWEIAAAERQRRDDVCTHSP